MDIVWIAFPLHPEIPEEGLTLEELFRGRSVDVDDMMARLRRVAQQEGFLAPQSNEATFAATFLG